LLDDYRTPKSDKTTFNNNIQAGLQNVAIPPHRAEAGSVGLATAATLPVAYLRIAAAVPSRMRKLLPGEFIKNHRKVRKYY
jgi:hypothetical protein